MIIIVFLTIMYYNSSKINRSNPVHSLFSSFAFATLICVALEMNASYSLSNRDKVSLAALIFSILLFFVSFLIVLYICFVYIRRVINLDLPSLKKIGNWSNYVVGVILAAALTLALFSVQVINESSVTFNNYVRYVYILFGVYELFTALLIVFNYKYINLKRRRIICMTVLIQILCLAYQAFRPHEFFAGLGITLVVVSYYMSLESEDVKLIEELGIEKENANLANIAKSQFIANVSHEIRTPINAVLGMDEMILRETREEKTRQYATDIKSAAQTLHGIINEILDMSKMESGKMEILPVNYNLRALIKDTANIVQMKMEAKNLRFEVEVDKDIPSGYYGDAQKIKQILNNILSNALKYTNTGSVSFKVSGKSLDNGKESLRFEVKDTGIGMKEEDLDQLFVEFKRFDLDQNRSVEGTGLGMAITMQLLTMMNSKLEAKSEYGVGSEFSFEITQDVWDDTPIGNLEEEHKVTEVYEQSFEAPNTKVLVVDDNAINRKVFMGLLKATLLDIDEAASGPECLELVKKNKYKIIFMDHMMPDMDGIECFHKLNSMEDNLSKDAKVIMLTANAVTGAKELYLNEGFDDFMAKPIIPEKLEEMIRKYL